MKDEKDIEPIKTKAVETAKDILSQKIGAIEGSRVMHRLLREAGVSEDDDALLSFMAIDSETDDLPIGEERQYWSSDALKEKDIEIARCENLYRQSATEACGSIVRRWKDLV